MIFQHEQSWFDLVTLVAVLCPVVYFDLKERRIPSVFPAVGACVAICAQVVRSHAFPIWSVAAGLFGFAFIWVLWFVSKGKIGLGDARLSAFLCVILGMSGWFFAVLVASVLGLAHLMLMVRTGRMTRRDSIPFAPFLAIGAVVSFLTSQTILSKAAHLVTATT